MGSSGGACARNARDQGAIIWRGSKRAWRTRAIGLALIWNTIDRTRTFLGGQSLALIEKAALFHSNGYRGEARMRMTGRRRYGGRNSSGKRFLHLLMESGITPMTQDIDLGGR